jgi:peptidyl-dipeptidase A
LPLRLLPTARDAEDFIAKVEADLVAEDEYASRVSWIAATFITDDTKWLSAKVSAERGTLAVAVPAGLPAMQRMREAPCGN